LAYTGATNISAGTLSIPSTGLLGSGGTYGGAVSISSGAVLNYSGTAAQVFNGAVSNSGLNYNGPAGLVLNGLVSGNGVLNQSGNGVLTLMASSNYTGNTNITSGALLLGNSAAAQNSTVVVNPNNGLRFAAGLGAATIGGLSGTGSLALQDQAGSPAAVNLTVGGNGATSAYYGALSGAGALTKLGTGTQTLSGSNSGYSGPVTVNGGVLAMTPGSGPVSLGGGTLRLVPPAQTIGLTSGSFTQDIVAEASAASPFAGTNAAFANWAFYENGAPSSTQGLPVSSARCSSSCSRTRATMRSR
jgi:autotransporter-associated beta strand protein